MIPMLPGAFNSEEIDGGEYNCPGTNPVPVHSFEVDFYVNTYPLILTEEMLAVFDECADWVIPCEDVTTTIAHEDDLLTVLHDWPTTMTVPREDFDLTLPAEIETLVIASDFPDVVIPPSSPMVTP